MPAGLADLDKTRFATEITSVVADGAMTVRYGLLPTPPDGKVSFRLDIDRYGENDLEVATLPHALTTYANDIYQVFMEASASGLHEWMEKTT